MTKETIFTQIESLIRPHFENKTTKFISLAISPYHPVIVVEFQTKLMNNEINRYNHEDYYETRCGRFIWATELKHYQLIEFEGLVKLYNRYLKAR